MFQIKSLPSVECGWARKASKRVYLFSSGRRIAVMVTDAWLAFTITLSTLLGLHAWVDAVCTVATLFPNLQWERSAALYPTLFAHSYTREDPLACRLLTYVVACMGLVRLCAVIFAYDPVLLALVGIMYILEG